MKNAIEIKGLVKKYGDFTALNDVSLHITDNEFFTLLGPSGCGKTTILRIIAGFEDITKGELLLYGEDIKSLPAFHRPINTVFQNYALFPHMSVFENIGFGLEMKGYQRQEIEKRSNEMIEMVQLGEFKNRKPAQLSGGQRQRVALARALAPSPKLLLLDESLSALDLKLRTAMRHELKAIQRETGITFVFVTHDQDEALTMSDRIAVLSQGEIQQIGTPTEIYEKPNNKFVADFIGDTNIFDAKILDIDDKHVKCSIEDGVIINASYYNLDDKKSDVVLSIRPEQIKIGLEKEKDSIEAEVYNKVYVGATTEIYLLLNNNTKLMARLNSKEEVANKIEEDQKVFVTIQDKSARALSK